MSANGHFKTFCWVLLKYNIIHHSIFQAANQLKMSVPKLFFTTDILQAPILFSRRGHRHHYTNMFIARYEATFRNINLRKRIITLTLKYPQ